MHIRSSSQHKFSKKWNLFSKQLLYFCYLYYKKITSQNVSSEPHLKIFFLFQRKAMFCSQDVRVFVFLTIPWFTKSTKSRWVLVHKTVCIFECIFWTISHLVIKLAQLVDINKGNNTGESFEQFGGLGLSSRSSLATCSN